MHRSPGLILERVAGAGLALLAGAAAAALAANHPVVPVAACVLAVVWFAVAWAMPSAWLVVVPALLPVADFSPWTGWIAVDEFDILLLVTLAAGYARRAWRGERARSVTWLAMAGGLVVFCAPGLWIGLHDAGSLHFGGFDDYRTPVNSVRVVKAMVYALALLPLIEEALAVGAARGRNASDLGHMNVAGREHPARPDDRPGLPAGRLLGFGVLAGLGFVTLIVLWERAAYPGLLDTSTPYRTTAAFWEMHVGGAAIDGYLALATPFVAWALWSARGKRQWLAAAVLALGVGYACLTTFSRGVYAAVLLPLLLLGIGLWARHWLSKLRWRTLATLLLLGLIGAETLAVLAPDSYMLRRMTRTQRDYVSRVAHWQQGLDLRRTAVDRWLGIGLGRLPAHYARASPRGEFSGAARWVATQNQAPEQVDGHGAARIDGPPTRERLGGYYGLTQQVPNSRRYRLQLNLRSRTGIDLFARVCQSHLLYDGDCQSVYLTWPADGDDWHRLDTELEGSDLPSPGPWPGRAAVLTISVANAGGSAEFDHVALLDATGRDVVENGGFEHDFAHWWPAAQFYFLPWHIDNLYLELLIERGALGLAVALALTIATFSRLLARAADQPIAPFIAASLAGACIVGGVSSLLDAPRTSFLLCLLIAFSWQLRPPPNAIIPAARR